MVAINIDYGACQGCGTCESLCPDVFKLEGEKAIVLKSEGSDSCNLEEVVNSCPTGAITVEGLEIVVKEKKPF
ncbi:MAG: ferredoxin [Euryarchaeota archaeon]|nr:ferredoxin [Euryarchaeota archaeon]